MQHNPSIYRKHVLSHLEKLIDLSISYQISLCKIDNMNINNNYINIMREVDNKTSRTRLDDYLLKINGKTSAYRSMTIDNEIYIECCNHIPYDKMLYQPKSDKNTSPYTACLNLIICKMEINLYGFKSFILEKDRFDIFRYRSFRRASKTRATRINNMLKRFRTLNLGYPSYLRSVFLINNNPKIEIYTCTYRSGFYHYYINQPRFNSKNFYNKYNNGIDIVNEILNIMDERDKEEIKIKYS